MARHERLRARLQEQVAGLDGAQLSLTSRFVNSITSDVPCERNVSSWLATESWMEEFTTRLKAHHALNDEPLSREHFEAAFNSSSHNCGWVTTPQDTPTQRFIDTTIAADGRSLNLSLKASSARRMLRDRIDISKLTEAAWLQDARRQVDRHRKLLEVFRQIRAACDSILILRGFRGASHEGIEYELAEIETTLFEAVEQLTVSDAQRGTIYVPTSASSAFKVGLDRSDAKIKLSIPRGSYFVHAVWQLPRPGAAL